MSILKTRNGLLLKNAAGLLSTTCGEDLDDSAICYCWVCPAWVDSDISQWNYDTIYDRGDYVSRDLRVFKSRQDDNTGHAPVSSPCGGSGHWPCVPNAWWMQCTRVRGNGNPSWNLGGYGNERGPYPSFTMTVHADTYDGGVIIDQQDFGPVELEWEYYGGFPGIYRMTCRYAGRVAVGGGDHIFTLEFTATATIVGWSYAGYVPILCTTDKWAMNGSCTYWGVIGGFGENVFFTWSAS